jgi:hypothetical protein
VPRWILWKRIRDYFGWPADLGVRDDNKYFYWIRYGDFSAVFREIVARDLRMLPDKAADLGEERGNHLAWKWGYAAEGAALAFRLTGDEWYAQKILQSFTQVLALRDTELSLTDNFHRKKMNAWGSGRLGSYDWVAHVTLAGRIVRPVTELLADLQAQPALRQKYRNEIEDLTQTISDILLEFESDYKPILGSEFSYYWSPETGGLEPLNHIHEVAAAFLNLYKLTGKESFLKRAEEIADVFFESAWKEESGALCWPYWPKWQYGKNNPRTEPVWKTQITMPFIRQIVAESGKYKDIDLAGLAVTLRDEILLPNYEIRFRMCSEKPRPLIAGRNYDSRMTGMVAWMAIKDLEPQAVDWLADLVAARPDFFKDGWFGRSVTYRMYPYMFNKRELKTDG